MLHSIQYFSDNQIKELKQCPGVNIDMDNRVAEVPFMAEGLFSTIAGCREQRQSQIKQEVKSITISEEIQIKPKNTQSTCVSITNDPEPAKICARCGNPGKRFCFGEVNSGRFNYDFFCLDCRPHDF